MCCFLTVLLFLGPRAGAVVYWLIDSDRWSAVFGSVIWPILGIIFVPWTTLVYAVVGLGGISLVEWLLLAAALVIDFSFYTGGGYFNRNRVPRYSS